MLKAAIIGGFFVCKNNKKSNKWYIKIKNKIMKRGNYRCNRNRKLQRH